MDDDLSFVGIGVPAIEAVVVNQALRVGNMERLSCASIRYGHCSAVLVGPDQTTVAVNDRCGSIIAEFVAIWAVAVRRVGFVDRKLLGSTERNRKRMQA